MTIDEIKAKVLAFFKTVKEKICDFFEPVNNALFGKGEQKRKDAENASKKNADADSDEKREKIFSENVQYASDTATSQATKVSVGKKIKSYIPLFADFVASLFYIAVVVLVLNFSLIEEMQNKINFPRVEFLEKVVTFISNFLGSFKKEFLPLNNPEWVILFLLIFVVFKLFAIKFSAIPFRKITPVLLMILQLLCLLLLLIRFESFYRFLEEVFRLPKENFEKKNLFLFIPFWFLTYITCQTALGCSVGIIKKKIKILFLVMFVFFIAIKIILSLLQS